MQIIIGLTGVKESGKTTTFNAIKELYPNAIEITLAKKLKDVCASVLGVPRDSFDDQNKKEKDLVVPVCLTQKTVGEIVRAFGFEPEYDKHVRQHVSVVLETPRRVAQYVGTEVLRTLSDDIHCLGATMNMPSDGVFVVTDMRFENEFNFFNTRYRCFYPLYISNYAAEAKVGPNSHVSERYVLEIAKRCTRIDNNGTREALKERVSSEVSFILSNAESRQNVG